jgi:hypothetical protein
MISKPVAKRARGLEIEVMVGASGVDQPEIPDPCVGQRIDRRLVGRGLRWSWLGRAQSKVVDDPFLWSLSSLRSRTDRSSA